MVENLSKSSYFVLVSGEFTANQRKLFNILLATAVKQLLDGKKINRFSIHIKQISKYLGYHGNNYEYIKDLMESLLVSRIKYAYADKDKDDFWEAYTPLSFVSYEKGLFKFEFPSIILTYLLNPKKYTSINLKLIKAFTSKYTVSLYEILKNSLHLGQKVYTLDTLKKLLGIPQEYYQRFSDFKKRVLDVAVNEINKTTFCDLHVSYERVFEVNKDTHKREIVGVKFFIKYKPLYGKLSEDFIHNLKQQDIPELQSLLKDNNFTNMLKSSIDNYGVVYVSDNISFSLQKHKEGKVKNLKGFITKAIQENWANTEIKQTNAVSNGLDIDKDTKQEQIVSSSIPLEDRKYFNRFFNATVRLKNTNEVFELNNYGDYIDKDGDIIPLSFFVTQYLDEDNLEFIKENQEYLSATNDEDIKKLFTEPLQ